MRSVSVGFGPGFLAREERRRIGQTLGGDQALERGQPVFVVARTVVGFTAIGGGLEFVRQRGGPLFPGEMPLLGELDRERERLRLPRLGKHRPAFVAGQTRQRREFSDSGVG